MAKARTVWMALKVLAFLLVLVILYFVLRGIGFSTILQAIRGADRASIWAAVLLHFTVFLLWSLRVELMMKREERGSITAIFPIYMAGVFGNVVTPGARVGGEPIRAYYMWKVYGGEKSRHFGLLLADKLGNVAVSMVFVLISVSFVALFVPLQLTAKIMLEAAVLLVILVVVSGFLLHRHIVADSGLLGRLLLLVYNFPLLKFVRRRFATYQHFEDYAIRKLDNVFSPIGQTARSPKAITKIVLLSTAAWLVFYLAHYVLFVGLGAEISFFGVLIIVSISNFLGDISVSPGGVGFMEAAMIGLCAAFGIDYSTAAAVTIISRGIFYLYGFGVGGLCFTVLACLYGRRQQDDQRKG